jgi:mediator of RNA polymerase II transcription subunit 5
MDPFAKEWALFLDRCLQHRIKAELFDAAVVQLHAKSPLPGRKLAALLLKPRSAAASSIDPRLVVYCERLLALKKIDASDLLAAAFQHSKDRPPTAPEEESESREDSSRWLNPPELEEIIFDRLHKAFSTGARPTSGAEGVRTVAIITRWMSAMVTSHTSDSMFQAMAGIQQHPHQSSINIREGLGMLVVALIENPKVLDLLSKKQLKGTTSCCLDRHIISGNMLTSSDVRKAFAQSLSSFIPFLSQTSLQIANRLELSQKEHEFHDKPLVTVNGDTGEGLDVAALQLDAVIDLPNINTRAGLYIFLNSLVSGIPTCFY